MGGNTLCLTVFFEQPFWVGVLERGGEGRYEACKLTFGAEPRDGEVYDFLLRNYSRLSFSPALCLEETPERTVNPKRALREARKSLEHTGVGTRAQQALQLQREQHRKERETRTRQQREAEEERRYALRQEKRREKHKGH